MTQDRATPNRDRSMLQQKMLAASYYGLLGLHPSASAQEIRQAYRDLSKLYHPDTTSLPSAIATNKFHELNEAYATLSSPERRLLYDQKIGYSRVAVAQPLPPLHQPAGKPRAAQTSSAYLDPTDRPLSPGELFALFILGLTFIGCLVLAITIGITRSDSALEPVTLQPQPVEQLSAPKSNDSVRETQTPPPTIESLILAHPVVPDPSSAATAAMPSPSPKLTHSLPALEETHDAPSA